MRFNVLRIIADQFYYNVHDVRTKDDTLLNVKLMIFFELQVRLYIFNNFYTECRLDNWPQIEDFNKLFFFFQDVEQMLDNTHDPIADFINNAASDVVAFCATLTYEEFLEKTSDLNKIEAFPQLTSRALKIGYQINKVVFRGFHSSDALQNMHDKAIQERTR